jgi:hypothetical protein
MRCRGNAGHLAPLPLSLDALRQGLNPGARKVAIGQVERLRAERSAPAAPNAGWWTVVGGVGSAAEASPHVVWRLRAAQRVVAAYGPAPNLAVAAVAGSVGAGLADRWSDLELDCYWREPPSDEDRRRPSRVLGVDLEGFWDYDEEEEEWSEVYQLGPLGVTISNFTVTTVERFLDAVLNDSDLDPVKHYRLAAIGSGRALRGARTLDTWRERLGTYPDALVVAVVEAVLNPDRFPGWTARQPLAERGDTIAVHSLLSAVAQGIFSAVLAINRIFQSHQLPKWQRRLLGTLPLRPTRIESRLDDIWHRGPLDAIAEAKH